MHILLEELITEDEEGIDSKIIASPISKIYPSFSNATDINSIPEPIRNQIRHFFEHYKELENKKYVKVMGWKNREEAIKKICESIERYRSR